LIKSLGAVDLIGEVQESGAVGKIRRRRIGRREPAEAVVEIEMRNLIGADDLSEEPAHVAAIHAAFDEIAAAAQRAAGGPAEGVEPPRYPVRPIKFVRPRYAFQCARERWVVAKAAGLVESQKPIAPRNRIAPDAQPLDFATKPAAAPPLKPMPPSAALRCQVMSQYAKQPRRQQMSRYCPDHTQEPALCRSIRIAGRQWQTSAPPLPFRPMPVQILPMGAPKVRLDETVPYLETEARDGLVAVNSGPNPFLESHAVFVLAGVRPVGESAVVVDRSGASTLIVTPAWDADRVAAVSQTSRTVATDDLPAALAS